MNMTKNALRSAVVAEPDQRRRPGRRPGHQGQHHRHRGGASACVINDGRTIDIDFGKVGIKRIDGNRYMQRIDYSIKCEFLDNSRQLKMKIMGGAAAFDGSVLTSSVNGLGIKLLANGKAFAINTPLNIDYANPPTLDAVPVKTAPSPWRKAISPAAPPCWWTTFKHPHPRNSRKSRNVSVAACRESCARGALSHQGI